MGIDAMIFFTSEKETPTFEWGSDDYTHRKITPGEGDWCPGATHRVELTGNNRFYGKHYERGVWPTIAGILMELFASPDITAVYYGGDSYEIIHEIKPEDVCEISLHYMKNGNRPYRETFSKTITKGESGK